jgi:hypothetical protein
LAHFIAPDLPEFLASWDKHGIWFSACLAYFDNETVTILGHQHGHRLSDLGLANHLALP